MSRTHLRPRHDPARKISLVSLPDKTCKIFSYLTRISLLLCLIFSICLVLYTTFSPNQNPFSNRLPPRTRTGTKLAPGPPTNISHVLFCIGGSTATWRDRSLYSSIWWVPNVTRGFVWLEQKIESHQSNKNVPAVKVSSPEWTRFKYSSSRSAVRIARIISDSVKLRLPDVRWFVMGDDDTVYYTDNLVSVLSRYDHKQMWYIGGNSESVEQDVIHTYDMAFGGGGFAISYPLAERLVTILDGCLDRYYYFYGSDQRIWACISEIGVPLSRERGFHQGNTRWRLREGSVVKVCSVLLCSVAHTLSTKEVTFVGLSKKRSILFKKKTLDIRGSAYGLLAAHPLAPLISLHHLENLEPLFPNHNQIDSLKSINRAYQVDPPRIFQQTFCHDSKRKWSISISWGYTVQLYPLLLPAMDLQTPEQTFKTWRSWSNGPFTFNTRPVEPDPCKRPVVFMLEQANEGRVNGSLTSYKRIVHAPGKTCKTTQYAQAMSVQRILVSSLKMEPDYWKKAPRRYCCELMNKGSIKNSSMQLRIRRCRNWESITSSLD
ncbi:hypothetical protein POTOM_036690 [Populus tomentosa]|uniref:Uncharacterized protein n=1 Tax=Populus tomentosa TaxID=118781 RepID=A0A8X7Z3D5_POPTO|nr:hypothetical protein POTOM_036690 [Populus tomentosa]